VASPVPPPDRLALHVAEVQPRPVPPGEPFRVELEIELQVAAPKRGPLDVTLAAEILRDGKVVYRAPAATVACTNGATTSVVKHLRAGRDPGSYELRITATADSLSDRGTVAFEIR
jgi:hypothetical protein